MCDRRGGARGVVGSGQVLCGEFTCCFFHVTPLDLFNWYVHWENNRDAGDVDGWEKGLGRNVILKISLNHKAALLQLENIPSSSSLSSLTLEASDTLLPPLGSHRRITRKLEVWQ